MNQAQALEIGESLLAKVGLLGKRMNILPGCPAASSSG